jgi:integrase
MDGRQVLPRAGKVAPSGRPTPPYVLLDADGNEVEPVVRWLRSLTLDDLPSTTIRSYAYETLRWYRLLWALSVDWDAATRSEADVLVGYLRNSKNPQRKRSKKSKSVPGSVNIVTGKRILPEGYSATGINHTETVIRSFYDWHKENGRGPAVNPWPINRREAEAKRHRSPLEAPTEYRRGTLRQKTPKRKVRAIPDRQWDALFAAMTCDRDRAIILMFVTSGARAEELLQVTLADIDWPGLRFYVVSKGTREREPVPASQEAFRMLSRYLDARGPADSSLPIWTTRRGPSRPLTYWAMRRIIQRANDKLGTNWTLHDLRHTASTRMANDPNMTITDVQKILRHQSLASTQVYIDADEEELFAKVQEHFERPRPERRPTAGYSADDLRTVFGD